MNKHRLFTITVGTDLDKDGNTLSDDQVKEAGHHAETSLCLAFGGCTSVNGAGSWVEPDDGLTIRESAAILSVVTDKPHAAGIVRVIAQTLKLNLNQEAVLVTSQDVTAAFV